MHANIYSLNTISQPQFSMDCANNKHGSLRSWKTSPKLFECDTIGINDNFYIDFSFQFKIVPIVIYVSLNSGTCRSSTMCVRFAQQNIVALNVYTKHKTIDKHKWKQKALRERCASLYVCKRSLELSNYIIMCWCQVSMNSMTLIDGIILLGSVSH